MLYGHGNQIFGVSNRIAVDFSSNIWYGVLNEKLVTHLQASLAQISNYPSVDAFDLQCEVSKYYGLDDGKVCISSGATEAFYLIAHAFKNESSTILFPSFSEYADAAKMYQHKLKFVLNSDVDVSIKITTKLVWIGNPNNPDGKLISLEVMEGMLKNNPQSIFIIDEAYGELCAGFQSATKLLDIYSNLIIVKSVTKLCSIPGLRLGYLLASNDLIKKIAAYRMPWGVSTMALEAGLFIFNCYDEFLLNTEAILRESKAFQMELSLLKGLEVVASNTNYFLIRLKNKRAADLKQFLIDEEGFLIRNCENFYGLSENHFRLAIQGVDNNRKCVRAVSKFLVKC